MPWAQAQPLDASKLLPTPEQIAGWSASQTIQWLLVVVLICVAIAAYFGMRALSKSNADVNANYDRSITLWKEQFSALNARYDRQEERHAEQDREINKSLRDVAVGLQSLSDTIRGNK